MKVHLIEQAVQAFVGRQIISPTDNWYYTHAMVGHFHIVWNSGLYGTLKEKYDQALRSDISQRWWKRDAYRPKEIMLHLIDIDAELAGIAWKDLQQEHANLDGRLSRFNYYGEQLLDLYRGSNPRAIETYHHQDASMMSLYLAGLFPEQYTLYPGLDAFQSFCRAIGSPDIPKVDDLVRYMKIATIVFTYLQKNDQYPLLLQQRNEERHKVKCIPMCIVCELVLFAAGGMTTYTR